MDKSVQVSGSSSHLVNLVAVVAAMGGLLFGYDTGIISAALLQITKEFQLSTAVQEIVTASIVAGALAGCVCAGPLSDLNGRRRTVMLAAAVFIGGTIIAASAQAIWLLTIGRFVLGLAIGASTQIVPIYIAEIAPAARRGRLVVLFQLAIIFGLLLSFVVGFVLRGASWHILFAIGVVPAIVLWIGMLFLPNSPRWMALKGRVEEARKILYRIRPSHGAADRELAEIIAAHDAQAPWSELAKPWVRPALIASVGVALLCQLTGINAVLYYAPTIFAGVGFGESSALLTSVAIGVSMMVATVFGMWAVDAVGRRTLLLWMTPLAVISLIVLGGMFTLGYTHGVGAWITAAAIVCYSMFNVGSLSVAVWLVGSEVYPLSCRGKGMSLVAAGHWGADLLISLTTLSLVQMLGAGGTFWIFGLINAGAFFFVLKYVPETKGRSLEEIESSLKQGRFLENIGVVHANR